MEICEQSQAFVQQDGDLVFDHTKFILRQGGEYFFARSSKRFPKSSTVDVSLLRTEKIPVDKVWPPMEPRFTAAPDPLPPNSFVKSPSLLYFGDTPAALEPGIQVTAEVEACEVLRQHPHPNIARYFGCVSEHGRIKGLCFVRYSMTLAQRLQDAASLDKALCLQGIKNGVDHMHNLGLVHNDLNPSNIMMDGDTPVIIDFDSYQRIGEKLGRKSGTTGWTIKGSEYARLENDEYSVAKIRELLMEGR
ncbi:hypothetical protein SPBR_09091 [Sporothrix brasiliensis 5110]|uniref:Protein kinase domain-containing protein n=1 Tax=Sporothrix brasiliensis 5110 TaxID=1398154 RepID=A0A0C2IWN7_9PEZI|nr:uncharacterized protein SPBR_09091 [Sporothrix brasiliensis 5110]KIH91140.1 hypothetical protein SPBR_09091 [Sporothrix brasiliensis 5110]